MPTRPRYFAQIIGELLYWLNEDRILFRSDYAIWQPRWLVEQFVDFQIPEDMQSELGVLTVRIGGSGGRSDRERSPIAASPFPLAVMALGP
jgi:hypothetical protein